MTSHPFVGRERELARLQQFLTQATAGHGQVVFVAGEAGAGKSMLVNEFVRRVQETDPQVVAVLGQCNAQTGIGDAYLPFRHILTTLAGAEEEEQATTTVNATNHARLRELMRVTGETLVDIAPDLIGIFVPGAALLSKILSTAAAKGNLAERLAQRIGKKEASTSTVTAINPVLDQEKIFAQYTDVLRTLAQQQTLILILDDLHWVDSASLRLLFHLVRELQASRVLLIGTYRPNDVALGRSLPGTGQMERHPLETTINELKRYHGDIVIDLGYTSVDEGRAFVDALIDSEPNRLDTDFRQALFTRTDGHPLFTVELLHSLQERGDLLQDATSCWTLGATLNWDELPARVEGVIEERIARLADDLRETLDIGSILGLDFVAQIVAQVANTNERAMMKDLARELDKRHRLVQEQGENRVGRHFLSVYRFTHALFQQFLYNQLSTSERRLLHGDVAAVLETFYAERCNEIAVQLAHHYREAGDDAKAAEYSSRAGNAATRTYAYVEAGLHYAQALSALERLPDSQENRRRRINILIRYADCSWGQADQNLVRLSQAEQLAQTLINEATDDVTNGIGQDQLLLARVHLSQGHSYWSRNDATMALHCLRQVLSEAQSGAANEALISTASALIGQILAWQGRFGEALPLLESTNKELEKTPLSWEVYSRVGALVAVLMQYGEINAGLERLERFLKHPQVSRNTMGIAAVHLWQISVYMATSDTERMREEARTVLALAKKGNDPVYSCLALAGEAVAESRLGNHTTAQRLMEKSEGLRQKIGTRFETERTIMGAAEIALNAGQNEAAITLATRAAALAKEAGRIDVEGMSHRVWALALAASDPRAWAEVNTHFAESLRLFEMGDACLQAAYTRVAWGKVALHRDDIAAACHHLEKAAVQYAASKLARELNRVQALLAEASATR